MKNKFILTITTILISLCGCTIINRDQAYQINSSYTFKSNGYDIIHKCYIDKKKSRFIWNYYGPNDETNYFYFIFDYNDIYLENSDEFRYVTLNNTEITFDDSDSTGLNKYEFTGPVTIYIYYDNASIEIKNIINNNTYNLEIDYVNWFSRPELFS